jgi:hypothetical protein
LKINDLLNCSLLHKFPFWKTYGKDKKKKLSILENLEVFQIIFLFQNIKVKE